MISPQAPEETGLSPALSAQPQFPDLCRPEKYVFIVTYGMSGDIPLQALLNRIEGYCIRGRNNNAVHHMVRSWCAAKAHLAARLQQGGTVSSEDFRRLDRMGLQLADSFVRNVIVPPEETRVAGFREIEFHRSSSFFEVELDFLHTFFPNARFVFNTRDHKAVSQLGWWRDMAPAKVSALLGSADRLFAEYTASHPERALLLHYEDYAKDVQKLAPLYAFLGESFDPTVLEQTLDKAGRDGTPHWMKA
ncbi:sulfotransferase [Pseudooceanicola nanhaiensis]|uniref:sulfotransferase n=1 Tax=Pseudooceanicola nanhaiensis TaxID=375761 RepID=UPI001CD7F65A|nr:sulfotransferase [Pseudooceanicola nanhaiensis]MCA0922782.1 sulfotransferase [Pseudooceanicola nanhaiensis]